MNRLTQLHADIESRLAGGAWTGVVWGNQNAIDRRLCGLGETHELTEWFVDWKRGGNTS